MSISVVAPEQYEAQLAAKKLGISEQFSCFNLPEIEIFESPRSHYRMRCEFRVWHDDDDLYYIMFEKGNNQVRIRIDNFPVVSERIHDVMFKLLEEIRPNEILRRKLFQIDFLSTLSGELLVTLLYHRPIEDDWVEEAKKLKEKFNIQLIGRSRKTKILLDQDFVIEKLDINGREYIYKQVENSFSQPNGEVCRHMIHWALDATQDAGGDMVELYCGNGNFTLPMAQNFRRVVATEISKTSVRAAKFNIEANGVDNVDVVRISSEEFSQVLSGAVEKRRTKDLGLNECDFTTVLVDPPRSGLDDDTVKQVQSYDNILYISCNPDTLKDNLEVLTQTHELKRFAIFDQFPYTEHLECGVYLTRK
ncbi:MULTISPECIES: tRNA (uridine(54)-C5)-methyltransferase TrmA [unclassified Neptuniibacter]|uniref:tRNA (uridine(54)-C5)-methyltransferase TrmA n=1 Tax=unclassified Neptuniibacter TaxID=2630693 RepID=UPI000C5FA55D|nr:MULTISPECIES: tRNA (uridine(54)-C5)-methyltransferase TrmA [unclassified Neptuniibacter]MAY42116.1 tRNA (uridine(54)-C5)-methyltransferase TrmA [Oceanospirillaceae bacterium]|tara:strand:+ start:5241 stop:6329 length:1089 start_codon:yes stop_codon:yes gene_type:complete